MRSGLLIVAAAALCACGGTSPSGFNFLDVTPAQPKIGDVVTVRFVATDYRGVPLPGATVNFSLQPATASTFVSLSPAQTQTNKGDGTASVQLVASAHVNGVVVVATSGDKTAVSPPITFAGAVPSARGFTFQCGPIAGDASGGIHNIRAYDDTRNLIAGIKLKCTAHVVDRNGDGLSGVSVSFITEAGTIAPSQTSVTDVDGNATVLYKTSYPLPEDVAPGTFTYAQCAAPQDCSKQLGDDRHPHYIAPLWMHPYEWVADPIGNFAGMFVGPFDNRPEPQRQDPIRPQFINNPRDNLVTIIAITTGEEEFEDLNNDGVWDNNEPYTDTTEPFVDANDNGTWDGAQPPPPTGNDYPAELYVDTNGNGKWDGKNGKWDANTLIWAEEKILWSGIPTFQDTPQAGLGKPSIGCYGPQCSNGAITGLNVPICGVDTAGTLTVLVADPWFNTMAQNGDQDGCAIGTSNAFTGGFKPLVASDPSSFGSGVLYSYPPVNPLSFQVGDAVDTCPLQPGQSPAFPWSCPTSATSCNGQGATFDAFVTCTLTSTPEQGDVLTFVGPGVSGLLQ